MKKIILMGAMGCGKTTLSQALQGESITYKKTQAVSFYPEIIDTPGEFIMHRSYYNALSVTATDAQIIGIVQSSLEDEQIFSPGFFNGWNKPVIGILTKIDLVEDEAQLERIRHHLKAAGAQKIFELSSVKNIGIEQLKTYLEVESV